MNWPSWSRGHAARWSSRARNACSCPIRWGVFGIGALVDRSVHPRAAIERASSYELTVPRFTPASAPRSMLPNAAASTLSPEALARLSSNPAAQARAE